ncbi:hypothetical protein QE152_g7837 [Popillia japonica]|uniref:Uncharacterized protein n=1 Tax=Popillia japonica TaxID=7064 RepID=A0AAW1MDK4_POPJA
MPKINYFRVTNGRGGRRGLLMVAEDGEVTQHISVQSIAYNLINLPGYGIRYCDMEFGIAIDGGKSGIH